MEKFICLCLERNSATVGIYVFMHTDLAGTLIVGLLSPEFFLMTFFLANSLILFKMPVVKPHTCMKFLSRLIFPRLLVILGDPRRPYPQDIEMRSGWLGRLMEGAPSETDQLVTGDSTLQELTQPSVSASHVSQPIGGLGRFYF